MTGIGWVADAGVGTLLGPLGEPLARYDFSGHRNHPHLRDVRPLNHAGVLTNHAPWDHRWHHGLWFSWKYLDDVLFWEDHEGFGGDHDGLGRSVVVATTATAPGDELVLHQVLRWVESRTGRVMVDEQRQMVVRVIDPDLGSWGIDWSHTWTAPMDVTLSATPFPQVAWGGYAGLSYRPARSMQAGELVVGSGGRSGADELHGGPVGWIGYFGRVDGAGTDDPENPATGGVVLLDHPQNARASSGYVASAEKEFGFLACAPLMHEPYTLAAGERLSLRFRSAVFGTVPSRERLDRLHTEFAEQPGPAGPVGVG